MHTKSFLPKCISIIAFLAALLVVSPQGVALAASQKQNASVQSHVGSKAKTSKATLMPLDASGCYYVTNDYDCTGIDPYGPGHRANPESPNCATDSYVVQYGATSYVGDNNGIGPYVEIDLMYSPHCESNWVQMTCLVCTAPANASMQTKIRRQAGNGLSAIDWDSYSVINGIFIYSVMVFAPYNAAQACGDLLHYFPQPQCGNAV